MIDHGLSDLQTVAAKALKAGVDMDMVGQSFIGTLGASVEAGIVSEDLKFFNSELDYDWEPGEFNIYIGTNSDEVKAGKVNWSK